MLRVEHSPENSAESHNKHHHHYAGNQRDDHVIADRHDFRAMLDYLFFCQFLYLSSSRNTIPGPCFAAVAK